jgi:hypothetical protein
MQAMTATTDRRMMALLGYSASSKGGRMRQNFYGAVESLVGADTCQAPKGASAICCPFSAELQVLIDE